MDGGAATPTPVQLLALRLLRSADVDDGLSGGSAFLQRVCLAAVAGLSLSGCVIHVVGSDGDSGVAAVSDASSTSVADLVFTTGEGPSLDAFARRRPVMVADLARESKRWPGYCQLALEMRVLAEFCFPLQVGGMALGVLDMYADTPRRLTEADFRLAVALTELATQSLLGGKPPWDRAAWDEPLLDYRAEIHQAQGMVMVDLGVDLAAALVRMRARAFSEGVPLIELAQAIIRGASLPAADEDGHR